MRQVALLTRCALVVLGIACLLMSCNNGESDQPESLDAELEGHHVAPFSTSHVTNIRGNEMHELHFAGGTTCGECHPSDQPMPVDQAHDVCADCHEEQTVEAPVWANHCLSCHHFTQVSQEYEDDPVKMVDNLCSKCHTGTGLGGSIYSLSGHGTSEMVICDHCHRPHDSNAPAAADLCATCHEELSEVRHPAGGQAKCSICHGAHRPPPDGTKLCTACHGKAENVLVHKIPNHPENCLECHNAHFTSIEIKGVCVDCHENMVYRGGANQPAAHRDCEHCHSLEDFSFKGSATCAHCHEEEGAIRYDDRVPSKHKSCTTCHAPHTWRASYERNCQLCHDTEGVLEHNLPTHAEADCEQCHNPHHTADMIPSGNCAECHGSVPSFGSGAPEMHTVCANCHPGADESDYEFIGWDDSCKLCHTEALPETELAWEDAPAGHQDCSLCHSTHNMGLASVADSCGICHADVLGEAPNDMHQECFNCHAQNHSVEFAGPEMTCAACHGEPPGAHDAAGHTDCFTCHAQHSFTPDLELCFVCHGDKLEDHYYDPESDVHCVDCHTFIE